MIRRRLSDKISGSLRYKLLVLVLFPILLVIPVTLGLAVYWNQSRTSAQMFHKVNTDLAVARDVFQRLQDEYLSRLAYLSDSYAFRTSFAEQNITELQHQLSVLVKTSDLGFLHITDLDGQRILGAEPSSIAIRNYSPLHRQAASGVPSAGVQVFTQQELAVQDVLLAADALLPLLDVSGKEARGVEDRALVIRVLYPVRNLDGEIVALMDGGVLLNKNRGFVDRIRDLVYGPGSLASGGIGSVAVTLDDVRVTTNIPLQAGDRALGTLISPTIRKAVLDLGQNWVDRSFEVNDWYISAYEPVVDIYGEKVGTLFVGFLDAPYRQAFMRDIAFLALLLMLGLGFAAMLAIRGASSIFRPIEIMTEVVRATQGGEQSRIGAIESRDEIGALAMQFDQMLDLLEQREDHIRQSAQQLETTVEERTHELREKNEHLQNTIRLLTQTKQQLVAAEKLAALGEFTAGVVHEINNPTAVILGNIELLREELGDSIAPANTEVDLIIEQVYRIRAILGNLRTYARPQEFGGPVEDVEVSSVVEHALVLVRHEIAEKRIVVEKNYALRAVAEIERQDLQQVIVNLLMNAVQALPVSGTIHLSTHGVEDGDVVIRVEDNGIGIESDQLARVFDPFYTAGKRGGTGLGLSVSFSLVRRYGGDITAESIKGAGTVFEVRLRRRACFADAGGIIPAAVGRIG